MGFNAALNKARDVSLPMGKRYMGLVHALERGHRSYHSMWEILQAEFGVRMGDEVNSDKLCEIADFLAKDRQQWLESQKKEHELVRIEKRHKKDEN